MIQVLNSMFLRAAIPFLANNKDLSEYFIMKMDILYGEYLVNVKIVHSQIMQIHDRDHTGPSLSGNVPPR